MLFALYTLVPIRFECLHPLSNGDVCKIFAVAYSCKVAQPCTVFRSCNLFSFQLDCEHFCINLGDKQRSAMTENVIVVQTFAGVNKVEFSSKRDEACHRVVITQPFAIGTAELVRSRKTFPRF